MGLKNGNKRYINPKGTILLELTIQDHWQHWAIKTPDEDENERIKRRYQT